MLGDTIEPPDFCRSVYIILNLDGQIMSTTVLLASPWIFIASYGPRLTLTLDMSVVACPSEAREVNSLTLFLIFLVVSNLLWSFSTHFFFKEKSISIMKKNIFLHFSNIFFFSHARKNFEKQFCCLDLYHAQSFPQCPFLTENLNNYSNKILLPRVAPLRDITVNNTSLV